MNKNMWISKRMFFAFLLACLLLSSCAPQAAVETVEVVQKAALVQTNTPEPTKTPLPTATATPTSTPKPTATATPNATATAEAAEKAYVEAKLKQIQPDIESYGYTMDQGHLIWANEDPIEVSVEEYNMSIYRNLDAPKAGNFIIQTKLTWNTTSGLAGCGIFFRQEEIEDGKANQFVLYRLQNAPAWIMSFYDYGQWQRDMTGWVYANSINDRNGDSNLVALVVDGRNIYPYINGKKQRLVEDITLKDGVFAVSAVQESGLSTCSFEDTWIWAIDS